MPPPNKLGLILYWLTPCIWLRSALTSRVRPWSTTGTMLTSEYSYSTTSGE